MGTLVVRRVESGSRDRLRAYKVLIDEREVGRLKRGESATLELSPGSHTVQVAIDWKRSARVDVSGDGDYTFRCRPGGGAFTGLRDLLKHEDGTWLVLEPDSADPPVSA
jgi:hypothetical protein